MSDNTNTLPQTQPPTWGETLRVYLEPATLRMLFLGFSAGLPLLLVLGTLSFWLREAGIDRTTIGFLSWVGLAYGFKWAWAPLVDRLPHSAAHALARPAAQLAAAGAGHDRRRPRRHGPGRSQAVAGAHRLVRACWWPSARPRRTSRWTLFASSRPTPSARRALAAAYQTGYRLAMIWAGAGVLWIAARAEIAGAATYQHGSLADRLSGDGGARWPVGVLTVLLSPEPVRQILPPARNAAAWLREALVEPFADFLRRYGWQAALILALIAVYRISDVVMGIMANPFYVDMGYTKDEVAAVTKVYGVVMTLAGAFLGGVLAMRFGVMRVLMLGAVLSAASNLLFAWLGSRGHDVQSLVFVISADNLSSGIASAAFIAYLSSLTNVNYSATQYALVQLDDAAAAQVAGRLLGQVRGRLRLRQLLHRPPPAWACRCCCWSGWLRAWRRQWPGQQMGSCRKKYRQAPTPRFARALQGPPAPSCRL